MRLCRRLAPQNPARFVTLLLTVASLHPAGAWAISSRTLIAPTGTFAFEELGTSVGTAGDMNGDGFSDVIVGTDAGGEDGRAYVYYGGPGADAVADLTLTGEVTGDGFGFSVRTAGDVNGDEFADVIVGAWGNDAGGEDAGRAYVYYGGPGADDVADLTLTGEAALDYFGNSAGTAGDVNGDGFSDVVVGAYANDALGSYTGRAYVFYGGPGADAVADLTLTGAAQDDRFGYSVGTAGDMNGDGFSDVIVGAFYNGAAGTAAGRAYVYYGGPGADAVADLTLTGALAGDYFGYSVGTAGDMNGDGFSDVIVGAVFNDANGSEAGRAYVYYGGPAANAVPDLILTGEVSGENFGYSVGTAGDVSGDGFSDVIVGAVFSDAGWVNAGRAYVFYGGPGADAVADLTLPGTETEERFGFEVGTAGDLDGDGHADVIVGAYGNDAGGSNAGRAYVVTTRPFEVLDPDGGEQWVAGKSVSVRWLGHDLADLWISFDGGASWSLLASGVGGAERNEFALTAPGTATAFAKIRVSASGEAVSYASSDVSDGVFRIVLPWDPPAAAHRLQLTPTGAAASDYFGLSVATAGDVNGDGFSDVIAGAYGSGSGAGQAYVYFGGPGADAVADLTLTGETAGDYFGISVGTAGDVNGDGFSDVIVGAYFNSVNGPGAGRAYVYYGGPAPDTVADLTLMGAAAFMNFGISVGTAGDVNGDGFSDVIVGALGLGVFSGNSGRAFVYYGGPGADAAADLMLVVGQAFDYFGCSVGTAGDVNGDGFSDMIVGANGNDAGGAEAGRAYVYYGGPNADAVADVTLTGAAAGDNFGISVGTAGDVNGDGFPDVVVGAYTNDAGGTDAGRAYVYFGGPAVDAVADLTPTGAVGGDDFGYSVGSAGDVNGDGFSDVIVGAFANDAGGTDAGRAYVYYGGPGTDAIADVMLTGPAAGDAFGASVGTAGDVNGDGFSDVIVGAYGNDAGGTDAGRAYLYDCNRYHLLSPIGGETWNVGATKTISWLGAEPANAWLSVDGGKTYDLLKSNVGGGETNALPIRVPHSPGKFSRIRVAPAANLKGSDESDSSFTIQTSVALLALLAAPAPGGQGAVITWQSDPGPADLAGYRLERASGGSAWSTIVALTRETSYEDAAAGPGSRYRLFAVNGFGEELLLGETALRPIAPLAAWPLPYRGGTLSISFAAAGGLGGGRGKADVSIFDVSGRLVRRITSGEYPAGHHVANWDGRDGGGRKVASGIYFLRSSSGGEQRTLRLSVLR